VRVAVIEGLFEGPKHSQRLCGSLEERGHRIVGLEEADVIIAHSGGWVFIPLSLPLKRLILIEPAYRTAKPFFFKFFGRLLFDLGHLRIRMVPERLWNVWYAFRYAGRWARLIRRIYQLPINPYLERSTTLVLGVTDRSWWSQKTVQRTGVSYTRIRGDHDFAWQNPDEFLDAAGL
jgi:hypothetical protein